MSKKTSFQVTIKLYQWQWWFLGGLGYKSWMVSATMFSSFIDGFGYTCYYCINIIGVQNPSELPDIKKKKKKGDTLREVTTMAS